MSELNIFLSALQSAFATSVQQAVASATAPLMERIAALESDLARAVSVVEQRTERIAALETKLTEANLFTQNTNVTIPIDEAKMVEALNSQEWFWHKIAGFVANNSEITGHDLEVVKDRVTALESEAQGENRYLNRDEVNELIAEAMDEHTSSYDHDDYDAHINDDDKHFDGDIEDAVRDALNGTSVTLSF